MTIVDAAQVAALRLMPKKVLNPGTRSKSVNQFSRRDFEVLSEDERQVFRVYTRQNLLDLDDFSTGIRWVRPSTMDLTLARYNGPSHPHLNPMESERIDFVPHIHEITDRYQLAQLRPEHFARLATHRTLKEALIRLSKDWNVTGFKDIAASDDDNDLPLFRT